MDSRLKQALRASRRSRRPLAPGWIHHTQYRLGDTSLGARSAARGIPGLPEGRGPVFERERALRPEAARAGSIFVQAA